MSEPARAPLGSPAGVVELRLQPTPKKGFLILRFLSEPRGIITHWGRGRPLACPGPESCPTALHRTRQTWKGYAAAEMWRDVPHEDWCPCVFEVTEHLYQVMQGHRLRGEVWKVWRELLKKDVEHVCGECIEECNGGLLRKAFNVEAAIWRVYHTKEILWDVEPYFPAPDLMVPSAGDRPIILQKPKAQEPALAAPSIPFAQRVEEYRRQQEQKHESNGTHPSSNGCK